MAKCTFNSLCSGLSVLLNYSANLEKNSLVQCFFQMREYLYLLFLWLSLQEFVIFNCSIGKRFLPPTSHSSFCRAGCRSPERKSRGTACIIKYNVSLTQYLINIQLDHVPHRHNIILLIWISLHLSCLADNARNASFFHDFLRRDILVSGSM